ncbi:MAG: tetratricopeptide repeat protein [Candidatus Hodarchaeota archaeon]
MVNWKTKKKLEENAPEHDYDKFTDDLREKLTLVLEKIDQIKKEIREQNNDLDRWNSLADLHSLLFLLKNEEDGVDNEFDLEKDVYYFSLKEYLLGYEAYKEGELEDARVYLEKSLQILQSNLLSWYLLGNLYFVEKKYDSAENAYKKGLKQCDASNLEILSNLGMTLMKTEKFDESEDFFMKALEIDKNNPFILNNLGLLYELREKFDDALNYYEKAVRADPKDKELWYNYGNLLGKRGEKEKRLFCFIKAEDLGFSAVTEIIEDLLKQGIKPESPFD